jgi:6-phosphogluconolactonase
MSVVVHRDASLLAAAVAARLVTSLVDAQAARGEASVVLTGGGIGGSTLRELAASNARDAIDWQRLHVWWGDERFLPSGHADRNDTQAREALLDGLPALPAEHVHPFPASDGPVGDDLDAAADAYAGELAAHAADGLAVPRFDVLLLGVGPDGHVASLFPGSPVRDEPGPVIAVRGAPKPPPTRLSLSRLAINAAREVWLVAAGEEKAAAAHAAIDEADSSDPVPAATVAGTEATRWLLDRAAAAQLAT